MKEKGMKKGFRSWLDERSGLSTIFTFMSEKTVPQHRHSIWYYTGSAILLLFAIQVITGFMLVFYYNPTLEGANQSVARIMTEIPLGWIIRSVHSWSSSFMIALVFIHLHMDHKGLSKAAGIDLDERSFSSLCLSGLRFHRLSPTVG